MAKNSKIEWTHHTFNPWWGCAKVSPACVNCYAEAWAKRTGNQVWGGRAPRKFFTDRHWREPMAWNEAAKKAGERNGSERPVGPEVEDGDGELGEQPGEPVARESRRERNAVEES